MSRTKARGARRSSRLVAAVSLAVVVASVTAACGGSTPTVSTSRVERGQVSTKVSASGALAAVTTQNLGFAKAAQLTEVSVKVGDTVRPGQVLAREDPFSFQQLVNQQQAQLNQQQAILDRLVRSPSVGGDRDSLNQANKILSATKDNGDAIHDRDQNAVFRARQARDLAQRQAEQAWQQYRQHGCSGISAPTATGGADADSDDSADSDEDSDSSGSSGSSMNPLSALTGGMGCTDADRTSLTTAKSSLLTAQTSYDTAKHTLDVDDTQAKITEENARQSVVTAQNTFNSDSSDKAPNIAAQAALVANGRALVANTQRDLDNTVLYAPVAGTVSTITGAVGEWVGAGGGTSALAPGTDAAIPGVGAAATADQSSASASGAPSATRPGGTAFMVLNNINTFQVVVPFEESDAVKVAPNQKVQVTFDALPDLTRDGTVLSIAPGGVDISGVTNYYATILLTDSDPRLRNGQTAEAGVLVSQLDNVLVVPNSAVIKQGGRSFVNAPGPDGKPTQVPFQPGLVGDDNTQVLSGLNEGQTFLLPQAQVTPNRNPGG
ncbi:MAG TPA: HlyD family efflux transporter periplasmic adaptor subunit [Pseudonocardia sp.]|nr:HlyD family efflux transporter periplasmic adaptor subunit [Pseudonocardia sp.]